MTDQENNQPLPAALRLERGVRRQRPVIGARPVDGGPTEWHGASGDGNYQTLCGLSLDDDLFEAVQGNQRITCPQCRATWLAARYWRWTLPPNKELTGRPQGAR